MKKEQRAKKIKKNKFRRPSALKLFSFIFMIISPLNFIYISLAFHNPILQPQYLLSRISVFNLLFICLPIVASFLILISSKMTYVTSQIIVIYHSLFCLITFFLNSNIYDLILSSEAFFFVTFIVYFSGQDVYSPFFSKEKRGWRKTLRRRLHVYINLEGTSHRCRDINEAGALVSWKSCTFSKGKKLKIILVMNHNKYELEANIIRKGQDYVGVQFNNVNLLLQQRIRQDMQEMELMRKFSAEVADEN